MSFKILSGHDRFKINIVGIDFQVPIQLKIELSPKNLEKANLLFYELIQQSSRNKSIKC